MQTKLETLIIEKEGEIAKVTLNRPERLNANNGAMARDLNATSRLLADDNDIRMVTIEGAGRAFCAGLDLKKLPKEDTDPMEMPPFLPEWENALRRFETMEPLVLCLIHGYAIGGGLQIALAADIRIGTPSAEFGLTAIEESLIPGLGTWRLPRYIGMGRAMKLNTLGNLIDGEEAKRIGLIEHIVDEDNPREEFREIVDDYMSNNSLGARLTQQMTNDAFDQTYEEALEQYFELQKQGLDHPDYEEGMAALREDREPDFSHE
jgi:enoyl-CoA hydratase/carnithine racemase